MERSVSNNLCDWLVISLYLHVSAVNVQTFPSTFPSGGLVAKATVQLFSEPRKHQ